MTDRLTARTGLHVHRSERTDALLAGLAQLLRSTPPDPFTPDLVAVPTPGIERFISQGLGSHLGASEGRANGVCANVAFPSPASVVRDVIGQAAGVNPNADPWSAHRSAWPLLSVIDAASDEPWSGPVARHLGRAQIARSARDGRELQGEDGHEQGDPSVREDRRFAVAARLAGMFASYASQRPAMVLEWARGGSTDGAGRALPGDLLWQPELWRRLRDEIGAASPAERLAMACQAVRENPTLVDLPARLSVFGPTRLPADHLQILAALAEGREVHLWLADASPAQWAALATAGGHGDDPVLRRLDRSGATARHPLVRSLGRDSRELRVRLAATSSRSDTDEQVPAALADLGTLLGALQQHVRDDLDPWDVRADVGPVRVSGDDRSVQIHACHGQPRQAEVVREVILGLLQADPTLEPRDIIIMCPDLGAFAPLLSATFSEASGAANALDLRLRIADRTPEQSNEVLAALAMLLDMVDGRIGLSALLDLASCGPVRTRFGLDSEALSRMTELASRAGVRWGLDEATRSEYLLDAQDGTWAWGLDRLLLGATLSEEGLPLLGDVLPLDDVQGGDVVLVGALAELVTRVEMIRDAMAGPHVLAHWVGVLEGAVVDLMDARGPESWQVPNALAAIRALTDRAGEYADGVPVRLADIRWMLGSALAGRPTRSNFRSGGLTVCGLEPMRSVPHRVVCLVGMDDGAFPRASVPEGDDILARDPLIGERDPRSEDRQLLLDALMAATEHLVITFTGADDRTNEPRPPCVPLGELLDAVDAMAVAPSGDPAREHVLTRHPLQPFDVRNFASGALGVSGPFSHDRSALAAARAGAGVRLPIGPFLPGDLPDAQVAELSLDQLSRFLDSPPASFLRQRVGVSLRGEDEPPSEQLPLELGGLDKWAVGARILDLRLRGARPHDVRAAELRRGSLPPGAIGAALLEEVLTDASTLADETARLRSGEPARRIPIGLDLPGGMRLTGSVPDVHGGQIVRATFSRGRASHRLRLWPELLALAAADATSRWDARMVAKDGVVALSAPDADRSLVLLGELAALHAAGMRSPLPLLPGSGSLYATRRLAGMSTSQGLRAARTGAWEARYGAERDLPEVSMLWGPSPDFAVLTAERPRSDEWWYPDEPTRFGALARRVWEPLLAAQVSAP